MQSESDYIVVGSGSGGSVVASRLSEDLGFSVLLVEADGSDKSLKIVMPGLADSLFGDPKYDWCFTTESDDDLKGFVKHTARGIFHPAASCKMGVDSSAVAGSKLSVHGVQSLYLVGASATPFVVSAHLSATRMMIGERLAEWLKAA